MKIFAGHKDLFRIVVFNFILGAVLVVWGTATFSREKVEDDKKIKVEDDYKIKIEFDTKKNYLEMELDIQFAVSIKELTEAQVKPSTEISNGTSEDRVLEFPLNKNLTVEPLTSGITISKTNYNNKNISLYKIFK